MMILLVVFHKCIIINLILILSGPSNSFWKEKKIKYALKLLMKDIFIRFHILLKYISV